MLVAPVDGPGERRALLRRLLSRVLACPLADVDVQHVEGAGPRLVRPAIGGLFLSSASRGGVAALAVGREPIGIDIEAVEDREPPWNVLHPDEARALRALAAEGRPVAFARMWSAKEAYLKATGTGLSREPASVPVTLAEPGLAVVRDGGHRASASLAQFRLRGADYVVALVVLGN